MDLTSLIICSLLATDIGFSLTALHYIRYRFIFSQGINEQKYLTVCAALTNPGDQEWANEKWKRLLENWFLKWLFWHLLWLNHLGSQLVTTNSNPTNLSTTMTSFAERENIANLGIAALFVSTINVIELFLAQLDWSIQLLSIFTAHLNCQVRI